MHTVIEGAYQNWVVVCPNGHIVWGSQVLHHCLYWAAVYEAVPAQVCRLHRCNH